MMEELENDDEVREIVVIGGTTITKMCFAEHLDSLKYAVYTRVNGNFA